MKKRKFLLSGGPFVSMFSLLIGPIFKISSYQASGCDELIRHENDENHQKTSYNADVFHCRTWLVKLRLLSVGPIIRNYIKMFWKSSFFHLYNGVHYRVIFSRQHSRIWCILKLSSKQLDNKEPEIRQTCIQNYPCTLPSYLL